MLREGLKNSLKIFNWKKIFCTRHSVSLLLYDFKPILHNENQNIEDNEEPASQCSCKGDIKELKKEWKKECNAMEKKINKLQV